MIIILLKMRWNTNIPKWDKKIYQKENSIYGEGEFFYVWEYNDEWKLEQLKENIEWKSEKNLEIENYIKKILKNLDVPEEYVPDFGKEYFYNIVKHPRDETSRMTILKFNNLIYILEDIY